SCDSSVIAAIRSGALTVLLPRVATGGPVPAPVSSDCTPSAPGRPGPSWPAQAGCSGADETRDGLGGLLELRLALLAAGAGGVEHAVLEVVVQQPHRDPGQSALQGADLGEDVDAVLLLVHHAVQPARLALDPLEPREV